MRPRYAMDKETTQKGDDCKRDTLSFWLKWIKIAKKDPKAKAHRENSKDAWNEYENTESDKGLDIANLQRTTSHSYPIYWASSKIIEPAFFSRLPKLVTRRRFDIDDPIAALGGTIIERLGTYAVESTDFDDVMRSAVGDFIHADKATTQVVYEADFEDVEERHDLAPIDDEVYLDEEGEVYEGEILQDDLGFFYIETVQRPINQKVYITSLCYDEILHTPDAKNESEIKEKAYYFKLSKDEAIKRFGEDICKKVNWKKLTEKDEDNNEVVSDSTEEYLEGYECWSKVNKTIYFVSDQLVDEFLDVVKDDPYGLDGFFPSPRFIISSKPSKSLYPKAAYVHCRRNIEELHKITDRVYDLIEGIRRRALVAGGNEELIAALNDLDAGEFVVMPNLQSIVEKGGIQNLIFYIPVQELVSAIGELQSLDEKFKNDFYEWFGVPDILRGVSDPIETLGAQQIKQNSAHDRFKESKKLVQRLARDSIEMMVDLMLGTFSDEKIAKIVGFQFMPTEDQSQFGQALDMVRNDDERNIRIEIETDSMNFVDQGLRAYQMQQATQTVTTGMREIAQTAEIDPDFARVSVTAVLHALETMMPAGKEFSQSIHQVSQKLFDKMDNPPPPAPPPPDYEGLKLQIQSQDMQLKQQVAMADAQRKNKELAQKDFELQVKLQESSRKVNQEETRIALDAAYQDFTMQMEAFDAKIKQAELGIEQYKARVLATEAMLEETRLAKEQEVAAVNALIESQNIATERMLNQQSQMQIPAPQVQVNIQQPKIKRRTIRPIYDQFGQIESMEATEETDGIDIERPLQLPPIEG